MREIVPDPLEIHAKAYAKRMERLTRLKNNPHFRHISLVNRALSIAGREDLLLVERAEIPLLDVVPHDHRDQSVLGNFGMDFAMITDKKPITEDGELGPIPAEVPIPITKEDLEELKRTGSPANNTWPDHRRKTAFYRALVVAPYVIVPLVLTMSNPSTEKPTVPLGPEVYVAHFVMAHLVDVNDNGAIRADNNLNTGYLISLHAQS